MAQVDTYLKRQAADPSMGYLDDVSKRFKSANEVIYTVQAITDENK